MAPVSMWDKYKALPPRTRIYIGLGGMVFAWGGLQVMDMLEEKLDPDRNKKDDATAPFTRSS